MMIVIDAIMSAGAAMMLSGIARKDTANWDSKLGATANTFAMTCLLWLTLRVWWLTFAGGI